MGSGLVNIAGSDKAGTGVALTVADRLSHTYRTEPHRRAGTGPAAVVAVSRHNAMVEILHVLFPLLEMPDKALFSWEQRRRALQHTKAYRTPYEIVSRPCRRLLDFQPDNLLCSAERPSSANTGQSSLHSVTAVQLIVAVTYIIGRKRADQSCVLGRDRASAQSAAYE